MKNVESNTRSGLELCSFFWRGVGRFVLKCLWSLILSVVFGVTFFFVGVLFGATGPWMEDLDQCASNENFDPTPNNPQ